MNCLARSLLLSTLPATLLATLRAQEKLTTQLDKSPAAPTPKQSAEKDR